MPYTTRWECYMHTPTQARLGVAWHEIHDPEPTKAVPIVLKGVCYSPAPLNGSNAFAPAIGDWFWDGFTVDHTTISGWDALWQRDLDKIRKLGANTIRVYCMLSRQLMSNGAIPNPWDFGHLFTHKKFLDLCWNNGDNPLYVLVGIPLPATMFWKQQYQGDDSIVTKYWTNVLRETAKTVGTHPAVMGFTIQNEQDGADVCYNNVDYAKFWWGQAQKLATIVKDAAPTKLIGMATHDDPVIPGKAASYMAHCPNIDFWGVNTYQTKTFDPVFNRIADVGPGYSGLKGAALKPVILTEYGFPATGHKDPDKLDSIYEDGGTRNKTAAVIGRMLPQAFKYPLCVGVYYFEYCDEWWNQPESRGNIWTWWGGPGDQGLPNGYWDNEGFGLYSIRRGDGLHNNDPIWDSAKNGPKTPIDVHTERKELTAKVQDAYSSISAIQPQVEIAAEA